MFFADARVAWWLLAVFGLWVLAWFLVPRLQPARRSAALRFSTLRQLLRLRRSNTVALRRLVQGLRLVSVGLLLVALARPQTGRTLVRVNTEGVDIVLVLDTSGSMQAVDLDAERPIAERRNRLEVSRDVVSEFVKKRESDQIGLVVFGSEAFTQCPLTLDHGIVSTFLERVELGVAGDATAIGSALGTAVKRLKDSQAKSKVVILLTDGRNTAGSLSPRKAAEIASTFDVKVYTVGVGTRDKAPFVVDGGLFGRRVVYQDVEMDEETLRAIATETGGAYFRAEDATALEQIYEQIDELEKTEIETESYQEYDEQYRWFVMPAVLLLLVEVVLLGTRFRKIP